MSSYHEEMLLYHEFSICRRLDASFLKEQWLRRRIAGKASIRRTSLEKDFFLKKKYKKFSQNRQVQVSKTLQAQSQNSRFKLNGKPFLNQNKENMKKQYMVQQYHHGKQDVQWDGFYNLRTKLKICLYLLAELTKVGTKTHLQTRENLQEVKTVNSLATPILSIPAPNVYSIDKINKIEVLPTASQCK